MLIYPVGGGGLKALADMSAKNVSFFMPPLSPRLRLHLYIYIVDNFPGQKAVTIVLKGKLYIFHRILSLQEIELEVKI